MLCYIVLYYIYHTVHRIPAVFRIPAITITHSTQDTYTQYTRYIHTGYLHTVHRILPIAAHICFCALTMASTSCWCICPARPCTITSPAV